MHAVVPRRLDLGPLRLAVGHGEDPPEVPGHVSSAKGHRVGLDVARLDLAGRDLLAGPALDRLEELPVVPRPPVVALAAELPAVDALEHPVHRRGAHPKQRVGDCGGYGRHGLGVLPDPFSAVGLEVSRAGASDFLPDRLERFRGFLPVGLAATFSLLELPMAQKELVGVLLLVPDRFADLLEYPVTLFS